MTQWLIKRFVKESEKTDKPTVREAYGRVAGVVGIICNLLLSLAKMITGLISGSIAITADAVNNLSDASSSVITLIGFKLSSKPADKEHPFGHARFEYIAGLAVSVMVLVIGIELGRSSIGKIIAPTKVDFSGWSFLVLGLSIGVKLWMAAFNQKIGKAINSTALEATAVDSRNDAITTVALLVAATIAYFTGIDLDGWMGVAVAAFILWSGISLVKETIDPLLGEAPDPVLVKYIDEKISSYEGVLGTHDLIVHDYGPSRRFASAHVEMSSAEDVLLSHDTIDNIERDFLEQDNIHLIIHYDPVVTGDKEIDSAHSWTLQQVKTIDERLTIHDFRMVEGPTHDNYIFDVVVPEDFAMPHEELQEKIQKVIQRGTKTIDTIVTIDDSYASIPQL